MENTAAKEPITHDMLIAAILAKHPDAQFLLMNCGMGCVSCPASQMESLQEAWGADSRRKGQREIILKPCTCM